MMTITPANRRPLSQAVNAMPNMGATILGWMKPITVGVVAKVQEDFQIKESVRTIETAGVKQPLSARALSLKPEGERNWSWWMIHCLPNLALANDDIVVWAGVRYRVMKQWPYDDNGFRQYDVIEDFRPENVPPTNERA